MNTIRFILSGAIFSLLLTPMQGNAEDIDLYSSAASVTGSDLPNVLFVLDNAANFNASSGATCTYDDTGSTPSLGTTTGGIEQCALNNAINALPVNSNGSAVVNIGIMVYNKHGMDDLYGCNESDIGGCLMKALAPMTVAGKASIMATIKAWTAGNVQANNEATAQAMQESWAYYAGKQGMSGTTYSSLALTGCQKNYTIFIGNAYTTSGTPGDASANPGARLASTISGNTALTSAQKTLLGATIQIPSGAYGSSAFTCSPSSYTMPNHTEASGLYADEWARYMYSTDLTTGAMPANRRIINYSIGVLGSACKADYPSLLTSMAIKGGGKYFPTGSAAEIQQAILQVLNEVQAVNSVFSSSSLPVSVNTQGTYLNQIYMGMFRPDAAGVPRWRGNLKQYQFSYNSTTQLLFLADATGSAALSAAGTGFLAPNAVSFWSCSNAANTTNKVTPYTTEPFNTTSLCNTDPAVGFWANSPNGVGLAWDLPDGEIVEKGGAAQILRLNNLTDSYAATPGSSTNPRNLYTYCPSGSGCAAALSNSANVFDTSNTAITDAMLGTGPVAISSITSAATIQAASTIPGASGAAATAVISALSKTGNTVTASVSASDLAKLSVGTQLSISTGATKYNCNPCTVATLNTSGNTFTYSNPGGSGTPVLPTTATIYTNSVTVTNNSHGLLVGQTVTLSTCTVHTALNTTVATATAVTANTFTLATSVTLATTGSDTGCKYTPNTAAVVTSASHGLAGGALVTIAGATPVGYNGTWMATISGTSSFTYQYTVAAPQASFTGSGATATSSGTNRDTLTRWVRGEDNYGDEASLCPPGSTAGSGNCPNPAVNIRPAVHGDVLHSRPVVINYGGATGVVVFYGGNDGVFRAVNGNQVNPASSSLPSPGAELWGFIPTEFFSKLKRLHDNSPALLLPSTPAGIIPTPQKKDYFVDGSTGIYQVIDGAGTTTKVYLYLVARRGARLMYALDVTNPAAPQFLWKHSNADTGFSELGQTWSQPKVAMVRGYANPVLIFGAGYDATAEDAEPPTADTMGRGIFILDAVTGAMVWRAGPSASATTCVSSFCQVAGMNYSIPSDITLIDRNSDGKIDRLYVGDVGGNLWRVDFEPAGGNTSGFWQVEKLAALGCATGVCAAGTAPRKIFYPPEVIATPAYDAVFVASGDREHPLYSTATQSACTVTNRAYLLKDMAPGMDGSGLVALTESSLFNATSTPWDGTLSGYSVTFNSCEKAVNAPLVTAGYLYFGTNRAQAPQNNTCEESLGEATGYRLSPFTGAYIASEFAGGGLPPSPVSGVVNVTDTTTRKIIQVPFCIGCGGGGGADGGAGGESALAASKPPINVLTSRSRTYWYIQGK